MQAFSLAAGARKRLGSVAAAALLAVGCSRGSPPPQLGVATPPRLDLHAADADVWSWRVRVDGALIGEGRVLQCQIELAGRSYPAASKGRSFGAEVALDAGDNTVRASCRDGAQRVLRSQTVRYRVRLHDDADVSARTELKSASQREPAWHAQAVVYGVVPPLFGEPPLRSVTAALDRLADLGVTVLWLSPIFATPAGDFGYAVTDYFSVRPDYGSAADLEQLVAAAHARGLHVLLDLPPNHTSAEHPYFVQASALGTGSHYFEFYDRGRDGQPTHYFDWQHLPNLNYANPEVQRWISEASMYWVRAFEVDGYRVDAAWGMARRNPGFAPRWVAMLRRSEPELLLVAEASARDEYYVDAGFDAAYDWSEELGHWAWQSVFESPHGIPSRLRAALEATAARTPPARVFRFLNNNDTGERFITRHGEPLTRVATAALLTLPGIPCIYAFDEIGAEFDPYAPMKAIGSVERPRLRELHRRLIALRRRTPALHGAGFEALSVSASDVFAFMRFEAADEREHALVALNFGASAETFALTLPARIRGARAQYRDALSERRVSATRDALSLSLPAFGMLVLVPVQPSGASN